jgi:Cu/Ag efflux protein CusF
MQLTRRVVTLGAALAAFVAAAPAEAAQSGTVLSYRGASHSLRVVNAAKQARTYRLQGKAPKGLVTGAKVRFSVHGKLATHLRVSGKAAAMHVRGTVAKTRAGGLGVKLADGKPLTVGNVTVTLVGFDDGAKVDVTVAVSDAGDINVLIKLDNGDETCTTACPFQAEGHVTAIDTAANTFTIDAGDEEKGYTFAVTDPALLATITVGDEVEVSATEGADGAYTATTIEVKKDEHPGDGGPRDLFGIVHEINATDGYFVLTHPGGATAPAPRSGDAFQRIYADAATLAGLTVDEIVHVVAAPGADNHLVAKSVEQVSLPPAPPIDVKGVVVSIDAGSFKLGSELDPNSGKGLTLFTTDGQLAGIAVGDHVAVHAHRTAPEHWVLDTITKLAPPPPPPPPPGPTVLATIDTAGQITAVHDDGSFDLLRPDGNHTVTWAVTDPKALRGSLGVGAYVKVRVLVVGTPQNHTFALGAIEAAA